MLAYRDRVGPEERPATSSVGRDLCLGRRRIHVHLGQPLLGRVRVRMP